MKKTEYSSVGEVSGRTCRARRETRKATSCPQSDQLPSVQRLDHSRKQAKHILTLRPSNSPGGYSPKENENFCPRGCNFTHNDPALGPTQTSTPLVNERGALCAYGGKPLSTKEQTGDTCHTWMTKHHAKWGEPIYVKFRKKAKPQ